MIVREVSTGCYYYYFYYYYFYYYYFYYYYYYYFYYYFYYYIYRLEYIYIYINIYISRMNAIQDVWLESVDCIYIIVVLNVSIPNRHPQSKKKTGSANQKLELESKLNYITSN